MIDNDIILGDFAVPLETIAREMQQRGRVFSPNEMLKSYHGRKYEVFKLMCRDQRRYRNIMADLDGRA